MHAILRGIDHTELDQTAVSQPAVDLVIGLSRGKVSKRYSYTDPNEDVVLVCRDDQATALVVADGHSGHEASHCLARALQSVLLPTIPVWDRHQAVRSFHTLNEQIRHTCRDLPPPHNTSRTTLTVAVVATDVDGQRYLTHASIGDSPTVVIRGGSVHPVSRDRHYFMGQRWSAPQVAGAMDYQKTDLEVDDVVVVLSDGYTNFADIDDLAAIDRSDPRQMVRRIIEVAGEGGAGDNVAVAVLLPPPTATGPRTAPEES
ncbi:MAG: PP2C family protein-serine/threonine phosphatase [Euzebya sp.]